jgi:stage IV sporulation protein FB
MNRVRATDIAAHIGQWVAMGLGLIGLFGSPMLVFIALFVWIGAVEEASLVHMSAALESVSVSDAMVTSFETVPAHATVAQVLERALHSMQSQFPVVLDGSLVGLVSADDLLREVARGRGLDPVSTIARPVDVTARPEENVERALEHLRESHSEVLAVMRDGSLVGLLIPRNVIQLADLRDALSGLSSGRRPFTDQTTAAHV